MQTHRDQFFFHSANLAAAMHVRCYECNTCVGAYETSIRKQLIEGATMREALDKCQLVRICCRVAFIADANIMEDLKQFGAANIDVDDVGTRIEQVVMHSRRISCETGHVIVDDDIDEMHGEQPYGDAD